MLPEMRPKSFGSFEKRAPGVYLVADCFSREKSFFFPSQGAVHQVREILNSAWKSVKSRVGEFPLDAVKPKPKPKLTQILRWANQNSKQLHEFGEKRGKMHASRWLLALLLIGWEKGTSFANHSQRELQQNKSRRELLSTLVSKAVLLGSFSCAFQSIALLMLISYSLSFCPLFSGWLDQETYY